jgi:thioredoxin-related protein
MKLRHFAAGVLACALVARLVGPSAAAAEEKLWTVDFEQAKAAAAKEGKDLLMEFTGSDWCPPCIALKKNVLDNEAFQTEAPKHFVLLKLDNPNDKSKQSEKEIAQYKTLSKTYKIEGVPTVILADAKGRPYAQFVGYGGDAADKYVKNLVAKTAVRKERDKLMSQAESAGGAEKAKLLAKAIEGISSDLVVSSYRETVDEIIKLDVDDKAGLKSKYETLLTRSGLKAKLDEIQTATRGDGAEKAAKKVDDLISEMKLSGDPLQEALFVKAVVLYRSDKAACKQALEAALAAAPKSDKAEQIKDILGRSFKDDTSSEEKKEKQKPAKRED